MFKQRTLLLIIALSALIWAGGCGGNSAPADAPADTATEADAEADAEAETTGSEEMEASEEMTESTEITASEEMTEPEEVEASDELTESEKMSESEEVTDEADTEEADAEEADAEEVDTEESTNDSGASNASLSSGSSEDVLSDVTLEVRSAEATEEGLMVQIAFVYSGDEPVRIVGSMGQSDFTLIDGAGAQYESPTLEGEVTGIGPEEGYWQPGGARIFDLLYPVGDASGPYTISVSTFDQIQFDAPLPE